MATEQPRKSEQRRSNGQRHNSDPSEVAATNDPLAGQHQQHGHQDPDLFAILGSMHLTTNQLQGLTSSSIPISSGSSTSAMPHPVVIASRKRKILDAGGSGKMNGGARHPHHRRNSDLDDDNNLQTPQCSQSGIFQFTFISFWKIRQADVVSIKIQAFSRVFS